MGAALLVLGPFLLGVGVAGAVVGGGIGMAGGAVGGSLHHKGLKLSDEDKARISADLSAGKAAVGVLGLIDQGPSIQAKLTPNSAAPQLPTTWWTKLLCSPRRPRADRLTIRGAKATQEMARLVGLHTILTEEPGDHRRVMH